MNGSLFMRSRSHWIAVGNVFLVLLLGMRGFDFCPPLFKIILLINLPAFWLLDLIRSAVHIDHLGGFLNLALVLIGVYAWARLICFILRVECYKFRRKRRPTDESRVAGQ